MSCVFCLSHGTLVSLSGFVCFSTSIIFLVAGLDDPLLSLVPTFSSNLLYFIVLGRIRIRAGGGDSVRIRSFVGDQVDVRETKIKNNKYQLQYPTTHYKIHRERSRETRTRMQMNLNKHTPQQTHKQTRTKNSHNTDGPDHHQNEPRQQQHRTAVPPTQRTKPAGASRTGSVPPPPSRPGTAHGRVLPRPRDGAVLRPAARAFSSFRRRAFPVVRLFWFVLRGCCAVRFFWRNAVNTMLLLPTLPL